METGMARQQSAQCLPRGSGLLLARFYTIRYIAPKLGQALHSFLFFPSHPITSRCPVARRSRRKQLSHTSLVPDVDGVVILQCMHFAVSPVVAKLAHTAPRSGCRPSRYRQVKDARAAALMTTPGQGRYLTQCSPCPSPAYGYRCLIVNVGMFVVGCTNSCSDCLSILRYSYAACKVRVRIVSCPKLRYLRILSAVRLRIPQLRVWLRLRLTYPGTCASLKGIRYLKHALNRARLWGQLLTQFSHSSPHLA